MEQSLSDSGWRGSPEGWLEAAYELLLESGVDSVKIQPLAAKLKLSRTSFYWFFKDREELLAALVARWRDKNTGGLIKQSEAYAESIGEAMLNIFDCWLDKSLFDSQFEFAVRSWALQSAEVTAEVQAADQSRLEAMKRMFMRFGFKDISADVRAAEANALRDLLKVLNHELMNALTPVASMSKSALDLLGDDTPESRVAAMKALERVVARTEGLTNFINAYRALTRLPPPVIRSCGLKLWLEVLCESFEAQWSDKGVRFETEVVENDLSLTRTRCGWGFPTCSTMGLRRRWKSPIRASACG